MPVVAHVSEPIDEPEVQIDDENIRAIVDRYRSVKAKYLVEIRDYNGELLPVAVRKALLHCATPEEASALAQYFGVDDADEVRAHSELW